MRSTSDLLMEYFLTKCTCRSSDVIGDSQKALKICLTNFKKLTNLNLDLQWLIYCLFETRDLPTVIVAKFFVMNILALISWWTIRPRERENMRNSLEVCPSRITTFLAIKLSKNCIWTSQSKQNTFLCYLKNFIIVVKRSVTSLCCLSGKELSN